MEATPVLYHIAPATGRPNHCRSLKRCPVGASQEEHYTSKEAAKAAWGAKQASGTLEEKAAKRNPGRPRKAASPALALLEEDETPTASALEDAEPTPEELLGLEEEGEDYFSGGAGGDIECEDCGETGGVRKRKDYYEEYAKGNDVWRDLCEDCAARLEDM